MSDIQTFSNSSLVSYTKISPNKTSPRNHIIDTITIHCIVGQWTAKQGCNYFANVGVKCAPNYVVGKDGSIGLSVDERDRSWCSSNGANDNRAITIEVASDTTHPYAVTDKALNALIELIADVCRRNNIKELKWKGDKSLIGQVDKQNMTVHRWFANKACPGDYLYNKHPHIVNEVNKKLGVVTNNTSSVKPIVKPVITPTVSVNTSNTLINNNINLTAGAKLQLSNVALYGSAYLKEKSNTKTGTFYIWSKDIINNKIRITNDTNNVGKSGKVTGWISVEDAKKSLLFVPYKVKVTADALRIRKGAGTNYGISGVIKDKGVYTIIAESQGVGATKWGQLKSKAGWISLDYVEKR